MSGVKDSGHTCAAKHYRYHYHLQCSTVLVPRRPGNSQKGGRGGQGRVNELEEAFSPWLLQGTLVLLAFLLALPWVPWISGFYFHRTSKKPLPARVS
jgi:hypothetical protein